MAKFLDTTGVSYHLQQLINKANEKLVLISPYLKINDRIKQSLEDKNRMKIDIRIVYRDNALQPEEYNWLKSMTSIRSSYCKGLHAKCYLNEKEAILTSMNLYEFSEVNNNEMGIYIEKDTDTELYKEIYEEAHRLIRISDEIVISVEKAAIKETNINKSTTKLKVDKKHGYCIRTGVEILFNTKKPMCEKAFDNWSKYKDENYPEKYCHFSGEESFGETTLAKPILRKNWVKAKEAHNLK